MMYLISGQPGNGKSLRAIWQMQQEYERNLAAHKEGKEPLRRFFTNIAGATTEENPDAFPWVEKLPEHNDWTQLPDGSFVIYDEAHSDGATPGLERYGALFPSTGKPGESSDMRIRAMSTHRHRGFDLVFVTQWPSKIHHQVRTLIGSHTHMNRSMGLQAAGVLSWSRVQPDPYDEKQRDKAEEEIWAYPKDLYGKYKSATLHTSSHKFKIPKKVVGGLCTLVVSVIAIWIVFSWIHNKGLAKAQEARGEAAPGEASLLAPAPPSSTAAPVLSPGMAQFASIATEPAPTLAGCVASDRGCRCFNVDGFQIDMSQHQCRALIAEPLPFNVYHQYSVGNPPESRSDPVSGSAAGGVVAYDPNERGESFPRSPGYPYTPPSMGR